MLPAKPMIVVIGGPNGAGKTSIAEDVLADTLEIQKFVNADAIARGLSAFDPDRAAIAAGRVMLTRLKELAKQRVSFAFESTLASRTFAPWLAGLKNDGYEVLVLYVSLRSQELALRRVKARVRRGGHSIPPDVVRRRFGRSACNLFDLYLPIATSCRIYDNSRDSPILIASGDPRNLVIHDRLRFGKLENIAHAQRNDRQKAL